MVQTMKAVKEKYRPDSTTIKANREFFEKYRKDSVTSRDPDRM